MVPELWIVDNPRVLSAVRANFWPIDLTAGLGMAEKKTSIRTRWGTAAAKMQRRAVLTCLVLLVTASCTSDPGRAVMPAGPVVAPSTPSNGEQVRYCSTGTASPLGLTMTINGVGPQDLWGTGTAWDQCTAAGKPTATTAVRPSWAGAMVGGFRVVLTSNGLQGSGRVDVR